MKDFTASLGFIISFLVLTLMITMILGEKVATMFLSLVLLGMVLVNADKISSLYSGVTKSVTTTKKG